jgi:glycerol uptake facilitator-like aquaporin
LLLSITRRQGLANLAAQVLGSMLGASILWGLFPCSQDQTTNLASNIVNDDYGNAKAIFAEFVGTSLLCYGK